MTRKVALAGALLLVAAIVAFAIITWRATQEQQRAEDLRRALNGIRVGVSTFEDIRRIAERYPARTRKKIGAAQFLLGVFGGGADGAVCSDG